MNDNITISNSYLDIVNGTYEKLNEPINGLPAYINEKGVLFSYSGRYWRLEKDEKELVNSLNSEEWGKLFIGQ